MEPLLRVDSIEKIYEGARSVAALRGVSLNAEAGDFIALMGPSGCGKSTLLHIIGGMDRPTSGSVVLGGKRIDSLPEEELARVRRRDIGFIFQFFKLLPTLSVIENITLPILLDGGSDREATSRARSLLERVGLSARSSHFPAELSGGEMQRVAIARAIIAKPSLLLADEPTGNLDSESGAEVMKLLGELNVEHNVTVILATHSNDAALAARRTVRMRDGLAETDISLSDNADRILQAL
ncbi:MAG: hypothetical protein DMF61_00540 [Blastocatellia bacterium AA13]|nr:MAG: hypothetical protein DMF61_00540 [Blastocatellia bacterium AA13]